jgi:NADH-quinone oxidoreductase subunit E
VDELERRLGVKAGGTTQDMRYTLNTVNCVGACALAPIIVIDDEYQPNMTAKKLGKQLRALNQAVASDGKEIAYV